MKNLEAGYSKRVQAFKEGGIDCITISYEDYLALHSKASLWDRLKTLDETEKFIMSIEELEEMAAIEDLK